MAQQYHCFHSVFILLSLASESKAATAGMKFCWEGCFSRIINSTRTREQGLTSISWETKALQASSTLPLLQHCQEAGGVHVNWGLDGRTDPPPTHVQRPVEKTVGRLFFNWRFKEAVAPRGEWDPAALEDPPAREKGFSLRNSAENSFHKAQQMN